MDERDPIEPASEVAASEAAPSEAPVGAKCSFFENLDAKLAAGHAISPGAPAPAPPAPAPPAAPPPALSREVWAELCVRFADAPPEDLVAELFKRGVSLEVWMRLDREYRRTLSGELRAGWWAAPAAPAFVLAPAPDALRGTADSPDVPAVMMAAIGRMPFVPPSPEREPEPAATGKRPAKTVQSKVVPAGAGLTMALDAGALQAPSLPFTGSTGSAGVVPAPDLTGEQYVSLRLELMLQPVPREETLRRYRVPTEAAYRALEERWRRPAQRRELEIAIATLGTSLRETLLG